MSARDGLDLFAEKVRGQEVSFEAHANLIVAQAIIEATDELVRLNKTMAVIAQEAALIRGLQ